MIKIAIFDKSTGATVETKLFKNEVALKAFEFYLNKQTAFGWKIA